MTLRGRVSAPCHSSWVRILLARIRATAVILTGGGPALLTDWLDLAHDAFPQHLPRIFGWLRVHEGVHQMCPGWCLCTDTATEWDVLDELLIEAGTAV